VVSRHVRGSILIIALWSIFLLTVFAVTLSYGVRQKLVLIKRLEERNKSRLLNEGCIKKAIFDVKRSQSKQYFFLRGSTQKTDVFDENEVDVVNDFPGTGKQSSFLAHNSENLSVYVGTFDEERKININTAGLSTLARLFKIVLGYDDMAAQELAASIIDWRDPDSLLTIPIGSAEDSYYRNFPYAYEAKDGPFEVLQELLLVKGMTNEVFEKIKKYITIYGDGKININTASAEVLAALGLSNTLVSKIIAFRCGEDGIVGSADDGVVDAPGNVAAAVEKRYPINIAEVKQLELIAEQLTTSPGYFMIKSIVQTPRGRLAETVCVVDREGNITYWHES
jgi:type II secretory pathway component PulK